MAAQKITPLLWFDNQAEEAVNFYVSVFKNAKKGTVTRHGDAGPGPKGSAMTVGFTLDGVEFTALNGGPVFQFSPAISFVVHCDTQKEIDDYWSRLSADPKAEQCGWLKDKYGLSWQIVPSMLSEWMTDKDATNRVMTALMPMKKLDIAKLESAEKGK
ncbi:MAG: VOC family protein [Alphaproteobacteria bacterium]|nr:VOC family protein [Alphaproteobacteria bacterium]